MTNPCIYERNKQTGKALWEIGKNGKRHRKVDVGATKAYKNRLVPNEQEMTTTLKQADLIENEYFRLRAKAVIGLVTVFGKRRIELALLQMADIYVENGMLNITFTIAKKHKRGFRQYIDFLKNKGNPQLLNKTLPELEADCTEWNKTPEGIHAKEVKRPKATPLTDKYAKLILEYYEYVKQHYPASKFLFPSGKPLFGSGYMIFPDSALSGRQLLNIVKEVNPKAWTHLYRKKKGTEVARKYGRTLESVFMVKDTLDLERQETALHYIEENVPKIETGET